MQQLLAQYSQTFQNVGEMRGLGGVPPEKVSKPRLLPWFRMHLPVLSLLWVTRNVDRLWQVLQDIARGRKYLG